MYSTRSLRVKNLMILETAANGKLGATAKKKNMNEQ